jgi:hypothetical protein
MQRIPRTYRCANSECARSLATADYHDAPFGDTEPERIHRVVEPMLPAFALLCPCGHYTVVRPR